MLNRLLSYFKRFLKNKEPATLSKYQEIIDLLLLAKDFNPHRHNDIRRLEVLEPNVVSYIQLLNMASAALTREIDFPSQKEFTLRLVKISTFYMNSQGQRLDITLARRDLINAALNFIMLYETVENKTLHSGQETYALFRTRTILINLEYLAKRLTI